MLILQRRAGESLVIGENITVSVVSVDGLRQGQAYTSINSPMPWVGGGSILSISCAASSWVSIIFLVTAMDQQAPARLPGSTPKVRREPEAGTKFFLVLFLTRKRIRGGYRVSPRLASQICGGCA